ncbi:ABC transporter permease [Nocardioides sp. GXZ039]|uniref:ABC transporter permease n=1 Tax=Nocardioides sp. GXZ039 TaxID=3136018 RepID=UPI0030F40A1A
MFVAWRDLRFARGRFALIAAVVALITLLVGFLAGLSGGLASQNVSAVLALPGDRIVLEDPDKGEPSFSESSLDKATIEAWRKADGVDAAVPIGIGQGRATHEGQPIAVALFGVPTDAGSSGVGDLAPHKADEIGLSAGAADQLEAKKGDKITIAEKTYTVAEVSGDLWYSHTPVVTMTPDAWEATDKALGGTGEATALVVSGDADWKAIAKDTGTVADGHIASLSALETFKSEIGSLGLMIAMLFGVSALVVGAFFTVWTMQRAGDIAVLKALGASTASLVRDALGQALIVLVVGIGVGLIAVIGFGTLASQALPFLLNPWTTLAPALAMAVLGLAGAAFALRTVTHADPLTALGSNR